MKAPLLSASALAVSMSVLATLVAAPARRSLHTTQQKPKEPTELASSGWATITGTVTYDGTPPAPRLIQLQGSRDEKQCHETKDQRQLVEQTWLVNKENKGVSDVALFLKPPADKYFKIHPLYLKQNNSHVTLSQPHCVYIPHTFVYWASFYDKNTGDWKRSGQKIKVLNDATFNHNTAWVGDEDLNPIGSVTLAPGKSQVLVFSAQDTPIRFKCDIHPWMYANCWALDNPYAARTDANGRFVIAHVPAGVPVRVVAWHEGAGFCHGGEAGKLMTFKDGERFKLNLKIRAK